RRRGARRRRRDGVRHRQAALTALARPPRLTAESERLLEDARGDAERFDVPVETRTILSHQGIAEVFDAAREHDVDTVVMGYGGARLAGGRVEGAFDELARELPCDFLVLKEREFDPSNVLLPTAGGYSSGLSAEVARALRDTVDADVSLLYVADDGELESGREFIAEWAAEHGLADAELLVETGDVERAIESAAVDRSLVVVGATEEGLLSRIVGGSLAISVLEELDTSVLLAERPRSRTLRERLLR
ncbi:universal stress protein, partial [Halobium palmae]